MNGLEVLALIFFAACSIGLFGLMVVRFRDVSCEYKERCRYYQKDGFECNFNLGMDCGAHNKWGERKDAWLLKV